MQSSPAECFNPHTIQANTQSLNVPTDVQSFPAQTSRFNRMRHAGMHTDNTTLSQVHPSDSLVSN